MKQHNDLPRGVPSVNTKSQNTHFMGNPLIAIERLQQKWMLADDVMKVLGITRGTLYNWRCKGLLVCSKVRGRIYFDAADVEAMLYNARNVKR